MADKFKPGDLVELKSTGPIMTIERVMHNSTGNAYVCSWFAGAKDNQKLFQEPALKAASLDDD